MARQQKAAEDQNQSELNKRMLEVQLTHSESGNPGSDSSLIYISNEIAARNLEEEWNQPEEIENVASLLEACETVQMLRELRKCAIPPVVFKAAAKGLRQASVSRLGIGCYCLTARRKGQQAPDSATGATGATNVTPTTATTEVTATTLTTKTTATTDATATTDITLATEVRRSSGSDDRLRGECNEQ